MKNNLKIKDARNLVLVAYSRREHRLYISTSFSYPPSPPSPSLHISRSFTTFISLKLSISSPPSPFLIKKEEVHPRVRCSLPIDTEIADSLASRNGIQQSKDDGKMKINKSNDRHLADPPYFSYLWGTKKKYNMYVFPYIISLTW